MISAYSHRGLGLSHRVDAMAIFEQVVKDIDPEGHVNVDFHHSRPIFQAPSCVARVCRCGFAASRKIPFCGFRKAVSKETLSIESH